MKRLNELYDCDYDTEIKDIKINSKECEKGDLFICTIGVTADRHDFVNDAIEHGASAIVAKKPIDVDVPVIYVDDPNKEVTNVAKKLFDYPEKKLHLIATTGTNGKTTVAQIIQMLIGKEKCGYMGTNGLISNTFSEQIRNTCPDADRLYKYFDRFVNDGEEYLSMEASSEAFFRDRLWGLEYDVGIFTNITQDHLNIHKTLENYIECKMQLLDLIKEDGVAILNKDDKYYEMEYKRAKSKIFTYGKDKTSDLVIDSYIQNNDSTDIKFIYKDKEYDVKSPLLGEFNIYNLAAAILTLIYYDYSIEDIIDKVKNIVGLDGRLEFIDRGQNYTIILDYAHTPEAFISLYKVINDLKKAKVITVSGSAGGREKEKRGDMGSVILNNSDLAIFTTDDPRTEDVNKIIDDLLSKTDKTNYKIIIDRTEAIRKAFDTAEKDDIVLIAGKGRDTYMAIGNEYLPYSDFDEINKYFENKKD